VIELIECKKHLTPDGLQQAPSLFLGIARIALKKSGGFVNIRASMNNGLSDVLKVAFPNTIPVLRPDVELKQIPNPKWLTGFVDGDGCFAIKAQKSAAYISGYSVYLGFIVTQHIRDSEMLKSIANYLQCGDFSVSSCPPPPALRARGGER
jgi:hypothetical protein